MTLFKKFFISTVLTALVTSSLFAGDLQSSPPGPPTDTINNTDVSNNPDEKDLETPTIQPFIIKKIAEIYLREVFGGLLEIKIETEKPADQNLLKYLYAVMPDLDILTYESGDRKDHIYDIFSSYVNNLDTIKLKKPDTYSTGQLLTILRKINLERKLNLPKDTLDCVFSPLNTLIQFVPNPGGLTGAVFSKALNIAQTSYIKVHEGIKNKCSKETYSDFARAQGPKITTQILEKEISRRIEEAHNKFMRDLKVPAIEIHDVLLSTDNLTPTKVMTYNGTDEYGYPEIRKTLKTIFSSKNMTQRVKVHDYGTEMVYWALNKFTSISDRGLKPTKTYKDFVLELSEIADGKNEDIVLPEAEAKNLKFFVARSLFYLENRSFIRKTLTSIHKVLTANSSALAAAVYNAHTHGDLQKNKEYFTKLMDSIINTSQMSLY